MPVQRSLQITSCWWWAEDREGPFWERSHLRWSLKYHHHRWAKEGILYIENFVSQIMNIESVWGTGGNRIIYFKAHRWVRVSVWRASELKNFEFLISGESLKNPGTE